MEEQSTDLLFKGRACRDRGLIEESRNYYEQCLVSSWTEGNLEAMASAVNEIGNLHILDGHYKQAREFFDKALALARRTRQTGLLGRFLKDMGNLKVLLGRYEKRVDDPLGQLRKFEMEKDWRKAANLYLELGSNFRRKDKLDEAVGFYSRSTRMARRAGDEELLFKSSVAMSTALARIDKCDQARKISIQVLKLARRCGEEEKLAQALLTFGLIERKRGRWDRAEKALEKAAARCCNPFSTELLAEISRELGLLNESRGRWRSALVYMSRAFSILEGLWYHKPGKYFEEKLSEAELHFFRIAHSIGQIVEIRTMLSPGHSERVARLGLELSKVLGLPPDEGKAILVAGFLHDLGKVRVRKDVMTRGGKFSEEKLALLKKHPEWGNDLLEDVEFSWGVKDIILHHHERTDGSGFPWGLRGEEIPLGARIIAISDVYDLLMSPRHEWKIDTGAEVLDIMEEEMKGKFDPELFDAFKKMITEQLVVLDGTGFNPRRYIGIWSTENTNERTG